MSNYIIHNGELYHYGVKGMKWGVRRYQNEDGSLTKEGQEQFIKGLNKTYRKEPLGRATHYNEDLDDFRKDENIKRLSTEGITQKLDAYHKAYMDVSDFQERWINENPENAKRFEDLLSDETGVYDREAAKFIVDAGIYKIEGTRAYDMFVLTLAPNLDCIEDPNYTNEHIDEYRALRKRKFDAFKDYVDETSRVANNFIGQYDKKTVSSARRYNAASAKSFVQAALMRNAEEDRFKRVDPSKLDF